MLSVIGKRIRSLLPFIGGRIKDPLFPLLVGNGFPCLSTIRERWVGGRYWGKKKKAVKTHTKNLSDRWKNGSSSYLVMG